MNYILIMLDDEVQARRRRRAKWFWVHLFLSADRRLQFGHYDQLIRALRMEDISSCFNCTRMEQLMFDAILNRVGPRIQKSDTNFSRAFETGLKLVRTPDVLIPYAQNLSTTILMYLLCIWVLCFLPYDVASESEITPCNKIDKPLVVYRFTEYVMTSITTLRT